MNAININKPVYSKTVFPVCIWMVYLIFVQMVKIVKLLSFLILFPLQWLIDVLFTAGGFTSDNVQFYQWTPNGRIDLDVNNAETLKSLNSSAMTYVILHGWHENSTQIEYELIAKNYHTLDHNANIILPDYGELASASYLEAPAIVERAGSSIGGKLTSLIELGLLHAKQMNIFSHSLGSHVAGRAARVIQYQLSERIARISATDPAGPLFRAPFGLGRLTDSLTSEDADVLDITHTSYLAGTSEAFGTVDTYVHLVAGRQPPCVEDSDSDELLLCDHRIARAYFTESILSCGFHQIGAFGVRIVYGEHMPLNASGVFRMRVNAKAPYARDYNTYPNC